MKYHKNLIPATIPDLKELQRIAYEAFKLHWLISHGYTAADLLAKYSEYWGEVESDEEGMYDFWEWLDETGFSGEIWPCLQEFLDHEFKDVSLIHQLLSPEQYDAYLSLPGVGNTTKTSGKAKVRVHKAVLEHRHGSYCETLCDSVENPKYTTDEAIKQLMATMWFKPCEEEDEDKDLESLGFDFSSAENGEAVSGRFESSDASFYYEGSSIVEVDAPNAENPKACSENRSMEGVCPVCGAALSLKEWYLNPNGVSQPWECPQCGATGVQEFVLVFSSHEDVENGEEEDDADLDCDGECIGCDRACADRIDY